MPAAPCASPDHRARPRPAPGRDPGTRRSPTSVAVGDPVPPLVDPPPLGERPKPIEHLRGDRLLELEPAQSGALLDGPDQLDALLGAHPANPLDQTLARQIALLDLERPLRSLQRGERGQE